MKLLFLTQTSALGPSSRYRVYQLLPLLEKLGIHCEVSPAIDEQLYRQLYLFTKERSSRRAAFLAAWRKRRDDLRRIDSFDAVFVQKGVFPGLYSGFESRIAGRKPLVFDFDDAIWLPREGGNPLLRALHRERTVQDILHCATAVIAGNEFLAEYARRFNRNVTVIPSAIDLDRYPSQLKLASMNARGQPVIGWIGSSTTLPYLKALRQVFEKLQFVPRVIASGDPTVLGFPVDFRPWRPENESAELAQFDIGIAPLPDTPWEQGKCGVKVLQYMACGIPVVASAVGVHKQIIQHGENGFLVRTEAEWIERLQVLLADAALRARLGASSRRRVGEKFAVTSAAAQIAAVLRRLGSD
ncbi:MAG: glycosyltransferase family 4 protein [Verrucomicrobiia bacterium]